MSGSQGGASKSACHFTRSSSEFYPSQRFLLMETVQHFADGAITKRIIKKGYGTKPKKDSTVSVHYDGYLVEGNTKFDSSRDRKASFEFQLCKGKIISAWETVIPTMEVGEMAEIICSSDQGYGDKGFPPIVPEKASLRYEVELLGTWEPAKAAQQRIDAAAAKKTEGNDFYKKNAYDQALFAYKKGREYIIDLWDCEPEELDQCRQLVIALQVNICACYLKLRQWDNAIEVGENALMRDPSNVKAYYRIAQAYLEKTEFEKGIQCIEAGLQAAPTDPDLKSMLHTLRNREKKWLEDSKNIYAKMIS
ncbi:cytochrome P450 monooxygenase 9 [Apophysomyces ossiformis]|uniref:peptidylprolyl isomerase n=1 Tax=Apophysomyces ossiformis TaxID=679940 RepID=A0A8H7BGG0_9FUNG|nr:cytochrome P450 monooxygenase 9 [Apophysomyces ossiformis]